MEVGHLPQIGSESAANCNTALAAASMAYHLHTARCGVVGGPLVPRGHFSPWRGICQMFAQWH